MTNICEVCQKNESIGVASSSLGAISFAYCESCLRDGAEPYGLIVSILSMVGHNWQNAVAEYIHDIVSASLEASGKSYDELVHDVDNSIEEEDEYFATLQRMDDHGMFGDDEEVLNKILEQKGEVK